jgi:hypothetical protein
MVVFCYKCGSLGFSSEDVDKATFCVECGEHLLDKEELYEFRSWFKDEYFATSQLSLISLRYKRKLEQEEKERQKAKENEEVKKGNNRPK